MGEFLRSPIKNLINLLIFSELGSVLQVRSAELMSESMRKISKQ